MRKSPSRPPHDNQQSQDNAFSRPSRPDGPRGAGKPFKKKNYDGRAGAPDGDRKRGDKARPYSGRISEGDKSHGKPSDKPRFSDDRKPSRPFRPDQDRKPTDEKRTGRSFDDRKNKAFDDGKPSWKRTSRDDKQEGRPFEKRKSFDKPSFKKDNERGGSQEGRPFEKRKSFDKPSFKKDNDREGGKEGRPFEKRKSFDKPAFKKDNDRESGQESRPFEKRKSFDKPAFRKDNDREGGQESRPFEKRKSFDKPSFRKDNDREGGQEGRPFEKKKSFDKSSFKKDSNRKDNDRKGDAFEKRGKPTDSRPFRERNKKPPVEKVVIPDEITFSKDIDDVLPGKYNTPPADTKPYDKVKKRIAEKNNQQNEKKPLTATGKKKHYHNHEDDDDDYDDDEKEINQTNGPRLEMPLNKFIAHSGECSRRDAAELVKQGKVKVNGELVLDPGYRVKSDDKVTLSGKKLTPQKGLSYILLNKPKGFITTNEDPQGRKTVMQLVDNSGIERLFPVGRLDRETSGLLLITNDGDLTQKLCHPSYNIKKVYQVTLDKPLTKADFDKIMEGVELEDGKAIVDALAYLEKKNELGLEIHSGRNRIVRRIFESLGYVVDKLDRVVYAGLTKKNLPRGKWRFLDPREIVLLKHFKS